MSKNDALRYLGYDGQEMDESLLRTIDDCYKRLENKGKSLYKVFDLRDDYSVKGTLLKLEGDSIKHILSESKKVILFAATLGREVDQMLNQLKYKNNTERMIYNACGSARIEEVLDDMMDLIVEKESGYLTPRFSPGYGDLSLEIQPMMLKILGGDKSLGIHCNSASLMIPIKSVTGIIGWSDQNMAVSYKICDDCLKRMVCDFKICKKGV